MGRHSTEIWHGRRWGKSILQRQWRELQARPADDTEKRLLTFRGSFLWVEPGWERRPD